MAQQSPQAQAIAYATQVAQLMAQLKALYGAISTLVTQNTDQSYDTVLQALPTYVKNSNGTFGLYDTTAGSGAVSVTQGGTLLTFSTSQSGLSGSYIVITGDTSNGLYLIGTGATTAWTITSPFGGSTVSAVGWGTTTPNIAHPIGVPVGTPLNMARNDVLTAEGCLANFQTYWTGAALGVQTNTPQKWADILNS